MRKLSKKLLLSILSVALVFIALGTTTFAWFSMNQKVNVTGMQVKTKVSNNLLIAPLDIDATSAPAESAYKTSMVTTLKAFLEPVSTIDGENFFYTATNNVDGEGKALSSVYIEYDASEPATDTTNYANKFSEVNGVTKTDAAGYPSTRAEGYIDYVFALKAQNAGSTPQYINITNIGLTYGTTDSTQKAFRTAIFVQDLGTADSRIAPSAGVDSLVTILAPSSAANFTSGQAVNSVSSLDDVTYGAASSVATVAAGTTHYYKVVVRLWLEGEDDTCNNTTFAPLTDQWAFDLTIELNGTEDGNVTVLGKNSGSKTNLNIGTAVTANTKIVDDTTYYEINGVTLNSAKLYKTANSAVAASDRIFIITADNHPVDVTNQINFVTQP